MDVSDDRGQALQVGAILLFGILVVGLALYQATIVPNQNERVEFDSYFDANGDMERLDSEIGAAAARDYSTRTAVSTGVNYPSRTVFVNPGPAGNRLRTTDAAAVRIANATAVSGEATNTAAYWNGSSHEYRTAGVRFDTNYNQLEAPPIVYESGVLYRPADRLADAPYGPTESIVVADGAVVDGERITLVTLGGDLDAGGTSPTIVAQPVSAHTRTVVVTGNDSENITLTIPTGLSAETWAEELVAEELEEGTVVAVNRNGTDVDVVLNGSRTFELRLAKIELRRQADASTVDPTAPTYVVGIAGDHQSVSVDKSGQLTAEVRDRYNNPKSGVDVTFSTDNGTFARNGESTRTVRTDGEGRASVRYEPDEVGSMDVNASIDGTGNQQLNTTTFTVNVDSATGVGGESTPATAAGDASGTVVLQTDVIATNGQGNNQYKNATFSFENAAAESINMSGLRLALATEFSQDGPSDGPREVIALTLRDANTSAVVATSEATVREGREPVFFENEDAFTLEAGQEYELDLELDSSFPLRTRNQALSIAIRVYFEGGFSGDYYGFIFDGA